MKWVTRSHVHVDRVACPWLITRFVDSEAEFIFAAANSVAGIVEASGAVPFDVRDAELGHHGKDCSFESIISKYGLADPALLRLARIVHAADTGDHAGEPLAAGLEAVAVGYSLRFPLDSENLNRQFEVYDALYAWCRLETSKS